MPNTETHEPQLEQLKQDIAQLRQELVRLRKHEAAITAFINTAQKRNFWVICMILIATIIGWLAGGSVWLRWYVLPVTLLLCGIFSAGAGALKFYATRKIARLEAVAANAEFAISEFKF